MNARIVVLVALIATTANVFAGESSFQRAHKDTKAMCDSLYSSPKLEPIIHKMLPKNGIWSPIQLSDDSKPTAAEKELLKEYFEVDAACLQLQRNMYTEHAIHSLSSLRRYWSAHNKIDGALYRGSITYGDAALAKAEAEDQLRSELEAVLMQAQSDEQARIAQAQRDEQNRIARAQRDEQERRSKQQAVYSAILNRDRGQTAIGAASAAMNGEPAKTTSNIVTCKRIMGEPHGQIAQFERMCPMNWQKI